MGNNIYDNINVIVNKANIDEFRLRHKKPKSNPKTKGVCNACNVNKANEIHHISYKNKDIIEVCRECHTIIHNSIRRKIEAIAAV